MSARFRYLTRNTLSKPSVFGGVNIWNLKTHGILFIWFVLVSCGAFFQPSLPLPHTHKKKNRNVPDFLIAMAFFPMQDPHDRCKRMTDQSVDRWEAVELKIICIGHGIALPSTVLSTSMCDSFVWLCCRRSTNWSLNLVKSFSSLFDYHG